MKFLQRQAYDELMAWKNSSSKSALLVTGARQVGKSTLIRKFAKDNFESFIEINFYENKDAVEAVNGAANASDFMLRLSAIASDKFIPNKTLIFLDEIQECNDIITWAKFLVEDDKYKFILSGSLLGLDLYNVSSLPVGFLRTLKMYPLNFFEFLCALGFSDELINHVKSSFENKTPVDNIVHKNIMDAFYKYLLCGGMPQAVSTFIESNQIKAVRDIHSEIYNMHLYDISKYVDDTVEKSHIKTIYESIPSQLNKINKRFKFVKLNNGSRFKHLATAFDWLANAGIAIPVTKVTEPLYPLQLAADINSFKFFMNDVGLLTSVCMPNVDLDILNKRSSINFGSIFENAIAQELYCKNESIFYYNTHSVGEVDFICQKNSGDINLIEVKSGKDYKRHNALNNLLKTKNYNFKGAYVLYDGNIKIDDKITYLPVYMACLID